MNEKAKFNPAEHLTQLKGKDYLEVKWRLVWFRLEHPEYGINTELLSITEDSAVYKATVTGENGNILSTGHGSETKRDFNDFIEKAETKAVGRALGMLGYGTQFAPDFDEGERIVDSPVDRSKKKAPAPAKKPEHVCEGCGKEIINPKNSAGQVVPIDEWEKMTHLYWAKTLCNDCIATGKFKKVTKVVE